MRTYPTFSPFLSTILNIIFRRHGLSYTTFACSDLHLSHATPLKDDINAVASVTVTNTGTVAGSEVVQLYTTLPTVSGLTHPPLALKAFAKVTLEPHQSKVVMLPLDKYAVSYWNERLERWIVEKGEYKVQVGTSSEDLPLAGRLIIEKTIEWNGL